MMDAPFHRLLIFVPEGDRTAKTVPVDLQDRWTVRLLKVLARLFGGATAFGRGVGAWREGAGAGAPIHWDRVTVVESWIDPDAPRLPRKVARLMREVARMRAALQQKVVGCMLDGRWLVDERGIRP